MSLQAALQLVQGVAASGTQRLRGLQSALDGVRGRVDRARGAFSSWLKTASQRPRSDTGQWLPDSSLFGRARAGLASVREGMATTANAASLLKGMIGGALLAGAGALASAGIHYAADALSFRENTLFAFQVLTRSSSKAQELMAFSDELARSLGKSTVEVGGSVRELLSKGFDPGMIRAVVSGMADLSTINPDANVKLLTMAISQVKSKGFLMMEELRGQIAEQGLDLQAVYAHIADNLKIKTSEVEKAISGKKVTADIGIKSILEAIQDMGGGGALGAVSAGKAVQTLGGAFDHAKAMGERMLLAINTGPVGSKLTSLALQAADLFDPSSESGKKMLAVLNDATSSVGSLFRDVSAADVINAFDSATTATRNFLGVAKGLGGGFFDGFREASVTVRQLKEELGLVGGPAEQAGSGFRAIGKALGYFVVGISLVASILGAIPEALRTLPENMRFIGREIINGITDGLESAKASLVAKMVSIAELLPDSVRRLLKIQSPSRVFMEIGGHTIAGFEAGLERGGQPQQRMLELVQPPPIPRPSLPLSRPGRSPGAASSAPRAITVEVGGITIEVHNARSMDDVLDQAEPTLRRRLTALLEEVALEAGAAGATP